MLSFIQTAAGISIALGAQMHTISEEQPHYAEVLEAVKRQATEEEVRAILNKDLLRVSAAVKDLQDREITADVVVNGGAVLFKDKAVHNTLTDRILQQLGEGFDLVPMARFLENLMQNPSYRAVQDLYTFLERGKMPITPDGCFLAYKAVRADYRDIHSGTFDNSIGCVVEMPRNAVDENPDRECSYGLHACSFDYLPSFSHANGHVMVCKINPRDVVAIPRDYNHTKMRVCRYEVVREYENYYSKDRTDVLADSSVATAEEPFLVEVSGTKPRTHRFAKLSDAAKAAETAADLASTEEVIVRNGLTDVELEHLDNPGFEGYAEDDPDGEEEDDADEWDEEALSYAIVRGESAEKIALGEYAPIEENIADLSQAKWKALEAHGIYEGQTIQVVEESDDRKARLTLH